MHLLNLTLQPPTAVHLAVYGNFSAPQAQEFLVARGDVLQLLRPDEAGRLEVIISTQVFGVVRALQPFRLTGGDRDFFVIGSDSGKIVVLEVNPTASRFEARQSEAYGKTGCRRITPGQYLAADPKGRAVLIGAVEKQQLVYVMNRDASSRLTISSPLEAHRSNAIHLGVVGLDVGFENPIFACLELDYADADADPSGQAAREAVKTLVCYELDLGLNHVTRRWSEQVVRSANMLVAIPGGGDGPGGVLVLGQNVVQYKNEGQPELTCAIPRRAGEHRDIIIVSSATHKQRDLFFVLLQSELGDLYKISLEYSGNTVDEIKIQFFDTVPVASSLCITKTGLLFCASEFSNHYLFQFLSIGEGDNTAKCSSLAMDPAEFPTFSLRKLTNLALASSSPSLSPVTQLLVDDLANEQTPQIYAFCGNSNRSSLRVLRHGLPITEMAASALPGVAKAVWCLKESYSDQHDKYIVVSFEDATLVLEVGESVEEVAQSGFLRDHGSLLVALLEDDSKLQIHTNGIRHIPKFQSVTEWKAPGKKVIEHCAANSRQVVISLAGGEIIYFELGQSGELAEKGKLDLGFEVCSLDLGEVPEGRQRFQFMAVGSWDNTVRVLSLDPNELFRQKSTLALTSHPHTLCLAQLQSEPAAPDSEHSSQALYLSIGLDNGVLQQSLVDPITAALTDSRSRFLGTNPVKLFRVFVEGKRSILALSSRSWISYFYQTRRHITPLSCEFLTYASSFDTEQCPGGIVALTNEGMKILTIDQLGDTFNQQKCNLRYTPRKAVVHLPSRRLVVVESDHNEYGAAYKRQHGLQIPDIHMVCEELDVNEHARSIATCVFHDRGGEAFFIVGTVKKLQLHPQKAVAGGCLRVYRLVEGMQLVLVHTTEIDDIPHAMCEFQGRLLVSVGRALRIYDLGKKKMLRKCENRNFPSILVELKALGDRIYASDMHESFHFVKYKKDENQLVIFADDCVPRFITSSVLLDYDTLCGADKFGNIFISRLPSEVSDEIDNPTGNRILWDSGLLNGAPNKLEQVAQFHVGDVVTSMVRTTLVPGGSEAIIYATIMGRIGVLIPFTSREDVDFYSHLEMYMRQEQPPLCGRDHLSYRSYYIPVKNITDGDLCEQFSTLSVEKQARVAEDLDRTPAEVLKKLEDIRNRLL
ncbi:pre-mrna-splicing factor rse1 [Plasmopara halstedii]|uniref:Pre-mrna-splicing factor rse1 n=1 Tax=Plasmopara halstedii TaxID=4781 RepID=A0A0N7L587_PLAHL|nr:pre-mrna-splicing factor rse1 [Plasmopara halstedii]CEG40787.1 pre-mrna-splicing factor rse1 [Plasmopara halstedii]|eukprot:XP_024577156.1 pre-mrna-splicing factor rse1 [Plasmopara halstedii]